MRGYVLVMSFHSHQKESSLYTLSMSMPHLFTYASSSLSACVCPLVAISIKPSTKFSSLAPRRTKPSFAMRTISIAMSCTVPSLNFV